MPTHRRIVHRPDGSIVMRQYVYMQPLVWEALEALMRGQGSRTISDAMAELVMDSLHQSPSKVRHDYRTH